MDPKKVAHEVRDVSSGVRLFTDWARSPDRFLAFRGQANLNWEVLPQVLRPDLGVAAHEDELVRELISLHPAEFPTDTSMFDKLVRMQHFALPTRLLDVTVNPLVALYFATDEDPRDTGADGAIIVFDGPNTRRKYFDSDTVSCIANLSNLSIEERDLIEKTKATTIPEFNRLHAVDRLLQFIRVEKPYLKERIVRTDLFKPNYVV
ncbi:MAG TPA: FRG domain-containing protein, partial [Allosphingosinicella sp.]|nr:FRG domain-containing protein [Allosphingosinicella sp.]